VSEPAAEPRALLRKLIHDVRTPLTVISGFADLLARDPEALGPDGTSDALRRIDDAAKELRDLVDAADDASRP
jgi:signal transduction histidine kinase